MDLTLHESLGFYAIEDYSDAAMKVETSADVRRACAEFLDTSIGGWKDDIGPDMSSRHVVHHLESSLGLE